MVSDIEFLKKVVAFKKQNSIEGLDAQRAEKELLERGWHGSAPYLCLIHCLVDCDIIKHSLVHRNDIDMTRMTVENRNLVAKRQRTVWELVSTKWNDPTFGPETEELPDLHSDFICSKTINFELMSGMVSATPEKY